MMDKTFDPAAVEARIAARWEEAQAFKAGRPLTSAVIGAAATPRAGEEIALPLPRASRGNGRRSG